MTEYGERLAGEAEARLLLRRPRTPVPPLRATARHARDREHRREQPLRLARTPAGQRRPSARLFAPSACPAARQLVAPTGTSRSTARTARYPEPRSSRRRQDPAVQSNKPKSLAQVKLQPGCTPSRSTTSPRSSPTSRPGGDGQEHSRPRRRQIRGSARTRNCKSNLSSNSLLAVMRLCGERRGVSPTVAASTGKHVGLTPRRSP